MHAKKNFEFNGAKLVLKHRGRVLLWSIFWIVTLPIISEYLLFKNIPWKISSLEPYVLRKLDDVWIHSAFEIERIKKSPSIPFFVYIGGSTGRSNLLPDHIVSARLNRATKAKKGFSSISSRVLSFTDVGKLAEKLGKFDGTLIFEIHPLRFSKIFYNLPILKPKRKNTGNYRPLKFFHAVISPRFSKVLSEHGFDIPLTEYFRLFKTAKVAGEVFSKKFKSLVKDGKVTPLVYNPNYLRFFNRRWPLFPKRPPYEQKKRKKIKDRAIKKAAKTYVSSHKFILELLNEVVDAAQENGNRVILLDLPENPAYEKQISLFYPHYGNMVKDFIKKKKVGYIDMRSCCLWTSDDFADVLHLNLSGRLKFVDELVRNLRILQKE